ncbi:MAG: PolC-type DNA polymerase III, partial [Clostridia bacterium]|nr:PolC-type DNA polymerase III [Clostridia bacterium]
ELIRISGLSHGTDVWLGNAQDLIKAGTCTISNVIGTRDSIMVYLIHKGLENSMAFKIMEIVRKGKATKELTDEHINAMKEHDVPQWYIDSCFKIKYMFPKAHAAAYVIAAMRLAWYKLYYPVEYYATYFTVRGKDLEVDTILEGRAAVKRRMRDISEKAASKNASDKELDTYGVLQIVNEMMARGFDFLPIDIYKSTATNYIVEDGRIRLPFSAMAGCGDAAAKQLEEAKYKKTGEDEIVRDGNGNPVIDEFLSIEDAQLRSRAPQTLVDKLKALGAFASLPDTTQLNLFDMM